MAEANSYEEQRRRQVEENKRKLEELRLHHLSAAVREAAVKPRLKRKAPKPRDAADDAPPRRSGRIATLPEQPDYRDNLGTGKPRQQKEVKPDHAYAIAKAEELQDELGSDYPTFVKPMPQSLTSLHIPAQFSMEHLPDNGMRMVLVDEEEEEFKVSYRPHSSSLVAGWSEFAIDNELVEGDCLVFQLIKRALFKVYIFRASSYYENEH
ncbi:B3 domain-containing protein Os06g0194400-like isoform X2 [Triticum urartu]|uniref:TF-B3 domain-containing protein n=1 Tax=Triticum urartu TaxID=4572 RepID=A0A8R7TED0_TRIUA|nr:B3 domain-containing protein Os06g0194400-like isoform X2 [Triticum urartu]